MQFDPTSIRGYAEALEHIKSLPDGMEILQGEQSTDGWTVVALANSLWEKSH